MQFSQVELNVPKKQGCGVGVKKSKLRNICDNRIRVEAKIFSEVRVGVGVRVGISKKVGVGTSKDARAGVGVGIKISNRVKRSMAACHLNWLHDHELFISMKHKDMIQNDTAVVVVDFKSAR